MGELRLPAAGVGDRELAGAAASFSGRRLQHPGARCAGLRRRNSPCGAGVLARALSGMRAVLSNLAQSARVFRAVFGNPDLRRGGLAVLGGHTAAGGAWVAILV